MDRFEPLGVGDATTMNRSDCARGPSDSLAHYDNAFAMTQAPRALPRSFGRFEVLDTLGRGGMAVVYLALDPIIGRKVALKVLRIDEYMDDADALETRGRFEREFRAAGTLQHTNIVTIYDVSTSEDDSAFIAMEYVDGESLKSIMRSGPPLEFTDVANLAIQLGSALDYAHSAGIVHRDVKPANILLTSAGTPKITDFGIAKAKAEAANLTQTGIVVGTPHFMSPEQVTAQPVDGRSDQFSVAVILYQLLTGELPFTGTDPPAILYKVVHEDPIPPTQFNENLNNGIEAVLLRALDKVPSLRFDSCSAFASELQEALGVESLSGSRLQAPPTSQLSRQSATGQRALRPARSAIWSRWLLAAATFALAVLVGLFIASNIADSQAALEQRPATAFTDLVRNTVTIIGAEDGSEIWINGQNSGVRTPDPVGLTGRIDTSVHLDLLRDGRRIASRDVVLVDGGDQLWEVTEPTPRPKRPRVDRATPAPADKTQTMTIISTPADARILLNGIEIAQSTPVEVELTEGQTYTVAAIRAGYLDQGFGFDFPGDLTVEMMSQHRIDFELEERPIPKNAGFLEIGGSGYPVVLTVGGEQHGPAPSLRVPVAPGEYEVTARSEQVSFERTWERLRVRPAEVEKLPLPATVTVQISTFPDNGQVSVDGRAIDEAPFTLTLVVGRHDFLVKWPGSERSRSLRKRVTRRTQKIHITAD